MKTYLCVIDVLPSGHFAALEVHAEDALAAERMAYQTGAERFGADIDVLQVVRTDVMVPVP